MEDDDETTKTIPPWVRLEYRVRAATSSTILAALLMLWAFYLLLLRETSATFLSTCEL